MADTDTDTQATQSTYDRLRGIATAAPPSPPAADAQADIDRQGQDILKQSQTETAAALQERDKIAAARRAAFGGSIGAPAPPKLQNMPPQQPQMPYQDAMQVFSNPAIVLATLGSLFSRTPATAALNAAAGAINGFRQGDQESYERYREQWKDNMQRTIEQNRTELEKYNAAWKGTEHSVHERQARMGLIAAESDDAVMRHALVSGDLNTAFKLMDLRQKSLDRLTNAWLRHEDYQARLDVARDKVQSKFKERDEMRQSVVTQIDAAIQMVKDAKESGDTVTGVRGAVGRGIEWAFGGGTEYSRFQELIKTIQLQTPVVLRGSGRVLAADRPTLDVIVPGLGVFKNPDEVIGGLTQLRQILSRKDIIAPERPETEMGSGELGDLNDRIQKALDAGYSLPEINERLRSQQQPSK